MCVDRHLPEGACTKRSGCHVLQALILKTTQFASHTHGGAGQYHRNSHHMNDFSQLWSQKEFQSFTRNEPRAHRNISRNNQVRTPTSIGHRTSASSSSSACHCLQICTRRFPIILIQKPPQAPSYCCIPEYQHPQHQIQILNLDLSH